ncbi:MAG: hypothetical protein U9R60_10645 [Bacteroidota bacterium]|nr:hypothetical protein [Bacteroidota bacterium]
MYKNQSLNKSVVSRAVISKISEEKTPEVVLAKHLNNYNTPSEVRIKGKDFGFTPDLAVFNQDEASFYEIELEKPKTTVKWRLFSLYAKKNKGNLFLVVPDYLKDDIKKEVDDKEISAEVLYFITE